MKRDTFFLSGTIILIIALGLQTFADEGMFLPDNIPGDLEGFQLSPEDIYKPGGGGLSDAVIIIGGGTGSFVSPNGLVLTNHHVAYGAIQRNSTPENNFLENGFYAGSYQDELPAPGYDAYITLNFIDITDRVLVAVNDKGSPADRSEALSKIIAQIEKECENLAEGTEGRVVSMLDGSAYYLFTYMKFKDIRLVYAPPGSIGNYGGDIDNWMWPRHTGDFSFMRVYTGPDGIPAEYSPDNIPFNSKAYLPISKQGFELGDFAFILGYPGGTMRYRTSYSVDWNLNHSLSFRIKIFRDLIDVLEAESKNNVELAIKFSSKIRGLNNVLKNNQGMVEGLKKSNLLARKKQEEKEFTRSLNKNRNLKKEYSDVLPSIDKVYREHAFGFETDSYLNYLRFAFTLSNAIKIQKWSEEKEKPDAEREPGYLDFQIPNMRKRMGLGFRDYHAPTDAKVLKYFLVNMANIPEDQHPEFLRDIIAGQNIKEYERTIGDFIETLYANTGIVKKEECMKMFDLSLAELDVLADPFIEFAIKVNAALKINKKKNDKFNGTITVLRPRYFKALAEWKGGDMYPDANRTIRFTQGTIKGYFPRDGVYYKHLTSLRGVIEKNTGEEPFDVPEKIVNLRTEHDFGEYMDKKLGDVPVAFLASTDITGGNSGSPVMNGKGEIIGCAFDGVYESMTSDWQFNDRLTRTISVDSRYILFVLDKFSDAKQLLKELTIK
ncbi:MAG: S46 family peptidase [Candidatus Marinimicrobia bacterium]|nr:S46 family peptidase [Candidatus Neomarinimicrobiota bacterium]